MGNGSVDKDILMESMRSGQGPPPEVAKAVKERRKSVKDEKNRGRNKGGGGDE